jgi:FixJ family two-component response regulator
MPTSLNIVAVIDDDPIMLEATSSLLSAFAFKTENYESAEAFLESVATSRAGCLVCDIHLGGASGLELARRLAAEGSKLPIIFVTGSDAESVRRQAIELGCVAFLRKPFFSSALIEALTKLRRDRAAC